MSFLYGGRRTNLLSTSKEERRFRLKGGRSLLEGQAKLTSFYLGKRAFFFFGKCPLIQVVGEKKRSD